jgi:hypothetical protein
MGPAMLAGVGGGRRRGRGVAAHAREQGRGRAAGDLESRFACVRAGDFGGLVNGSRADEPTLEPTFPFTDCTKPSLARLEFLRALSSRAEPRASSAQLNSTPTWAPPRVKFFH